MEREDSHPEPFEVEEAATPEGDSDEEKPEKESEQKEKRIYFLQHRSSSMFEMQLASYRTNKSPTLRYGQIPFEEKTKSEDSKGLALESIWMDEDMHDLLKAYAVKMFAEENIFFLEEVLAMKENNESERVQKIYSDYIAPNSPMEVNMTDSTKSKIRERMKAPEGKEDITIFDIAIDELVKLVRESVLKGFLEEYEAKAKEISRPLPYGKKRVVVIGGGFLGLTTARLLDPMPRFEVTLIDTKEYFEYTPCIIHSLIHPEVASKWRVPFKQVMQHGRLLVSSVESIHKDHVLCGNEKIPYDYLVLGTGSNYTSNFKGMNVTTSYRLKKLAAEYKSLEDSKEILVIGGGLVGVEISTEIKSKFPEKRVVIVEANNTLLKRTPDKAQRLAIKECQDLGIELILGERVTSFNAFKGTFQTSTGRKMGFDKVYVATGPVPNTGFIKRNLPKILDDKNHIRVEPTLQVTGFDNLFSGGDCSNAPVEKLAFNSSVHGMAIARNICRLEKNKSAAAQGTRGIPKPRRIQWAQIINFGPQKAMVIYRESGTFMSKAAATYKDSFSMATMEMVIGKRDWVGVFGKPPSPLALPDEPKNQKKK